MFLEKFLSHKTGKQIKSEVISPWRRAICGDLTSVFRPYHGEDLKTPERLKKEKVITGIQNARSKPAQVTPTALAKTEIDKINTYLPFAKDASTFAAVQEQGTRLACALPYQLTVDAELNAEKTALKLSFAAAKTSFGQQLEVAGAAFNVYTSGKYKKEAGKTWAYAVKAGDSLTDSWEITAFENGNYDLNVNGPNGFFREFKGDAADPAIEMACAYEQSGLLKKLTGNLQLTLENKENTAVEVLIKDEVYMANSKTIKVAANSKKIVTLNLQKSKGWYDFVIAVAGRPNFLKHYAGHVETGEESISDPFMGGMIA